MPRSSDMAEQRARAVAAKLSLPHQGFVLGRPRVRRLVEPVRAGGMVSLVAGPGYGKTAFIVDLLGSSQSHTLYFALDEGDRDPVRFLSYLAAGLAEAASGPSGAAALQWPKVAEAEVEAVAPTDSMDLTAQLVDMIAAEAGRPTVVALDDFHLVDASPGVVEAVRLIVHGLPPGWIMLLSSRRPLPLGLDSLSLGGRFVAIQARDLRLTPSEVTAWAAQNWGFALQPTEARALWRLTEGWPAALVLLGQRLLSRGAAVTSRDIMSLVARGRDLRDYLERHILSGLDPATADVMLTAGLLRRVIFPRDEALLPGETGEAEARLEELVARGFLVTRSGRRSYTIHPLVRAYAERMALKKGADRGLLKAAGLHLERTGEHQRAASLYLRAGCLEDAGRPLRHLALSSLNAVIDYSDDEWSGLLPEDADTPAEAWLLVTKAGMLQRQSKYAGAAILYEKAARLLSQAGDHEGLLPVLIGSAFCLFNQGRWEDSLAVMKRCRSLARTPHEKVEVLVVEGNVLLSLCRWDEAVEDWERALAIAPAAGKEALSHRIHLHRARLFYAMGQYRVARQWAEKAIGRGSGPTTPAHAMAISAATTVAWQTGEYELAGRYADECLALVRTRGYAFFEIPTLLDQAAVAQGMWGYRRAVELIREAQRVAAEAGDSEGSFWAEDMLGDLCRRNRNARRALEHHRTALEIVERSGLSASERVRAMTAAGMDLAVLGQEAEAKTSLEETIRLSRRWGLRGSLAPSLFYLGWLHALAGREHEAARASVEAMRIAEENDQVHFFCQEARVAMPILALCDRFGAGSFVRAKVLPSLSESLRSYFEGLTTGRTYPTDVSLGPPRRRGLSRAFSDPVAGIQMDQATLQGIESLTDRERQVLKLIALGMPNKAIAAKMFITDKTVKTHANHVFHKLGVTSRLQATLVFQSYQRARRAGGAGRTRRP